MSDELLDDPEPYYSKALRCISALQGACWAAFASYLSPWAVLAVVVVIGGKAIYECLKVAVVVCKDDEA